MFCSSVNGLFEILHASYTLFGRQNGFSAPLQASNMFYVCPNGLSEPLQASYMHAEVKTDYAKHYRPPTPLVVVKKLLS